MLWYIDKESYFAENMVKVDEILVRHNKIFAYLCHVNSFE